MKNTIQLLIVIVCITCFEVTPGLGWYSCSGKEIRHYVKTRNHCHELGGKCCWGGTVRRAVEGANDDCGSCYDGQPLMDYCKMTGHLLDCSHGGCQGEPIDRNRPHTMVECNDRGGKCCALNMNGVGPWTDVSYRHGYCWFCFSEHGHGPGFTRDLTPPDNDGVLVG